jgi:hypothetical protein
MMDKLMNPVYKAIRDSRVTNFDAEKSRQVYYDEYLSKHRPKSDHVLDD